MMNRKGLRHLARNWFSGMPRRRDASRRYAVPGRSPLELLEERDAPAGISFVQNIGSASSANLWGGSSSLTVKVANGHAVAAGDSLIVEVALNPSASSIRVSDSAGNAYSVDASLKGSDSIQTFILSAHGVTAIPAGGWVRVQTWGSVTAAALSISEFSGLLLPKPLDRTAAASGSASATITSGPVSTSVAS